MQIPKLKNKIMSSCDWMLIMYCKAQKERLSGRPLSDYPNTKSYIKLNVMYPIEDKVRRISDAQITKMHNRLTNV